MASIREIRQLENEVEELKNRVNLLRRRTLVLEAADKTRSHKGINKALENVEEVEQIQVRYRLSETELLFKFQKFTGMSVARVDGNKYKVMFHPMLGHAYDPDKWSVTVQTTENGYELGRCWLPQCITLKDLDTSKPINELLGHISDLLYAYQNRKKQYCKLEKHVEGKKTLLSSAEGFLSININMTLTVEDMSYEVQVNLVYEPMKTLPHEMFVFGHEATRPRKGGFRAKMNEEDMDALREQCQPFLALPLKQAFDEAF